MGNEDGAHRYLRHSAAYRLSGKGGYNVDSGRKIRHDKFGSRVEVYLPPGTGRLLR